MPDLTKEQFLARCANAFDAGLVRPDTVRLLDRWLDFVMRFEGGQMRYVAEFMEDEARRHEFTSSRTLANDRDGYDLIRLSAILNHKCQTCATDPEAWWTRGALCPHRTPTETSDAANVTASLADAFASLTAAANMADLPVDAMEAGKDRVWLYVPSGDKSVPQFVAKHGSHWQVWPVEVFAP